MKPYKTALARWITAYGVVKLSESLKVNISTVRHWRTGHVLPRPEQMYHIVKLSQAAPTCDQMICEYFNDSSNHGKYTK